MGENGSGKPQNLPVLADNSTTGYQLKSRTAPQLKPYHFQPGKSGNPAGRPRNPARLTKELKKKLMEFTTVKIDGQDVRMRYKDLVVMSTIKLAMKGNPKALETVWDRSDGKLTDALELTGKDGVPLHPKRIEIALVRATDGNNTL